MDQRPGWATPLPPLCSRVLLVNTTFSTQNPNRTYDVYFYDSVVDGTPAYDHMILVRIAADKNGSLASANLAVGDFRGIKLRARTASLARAQGRRQLLTKLISMSADLSSFKLYFTSVTRPIASCTTPACNALPPGGAGEDRLEKYIADNLPGYQAADFAPMEARIIDEDTYVSRAATSKKRTATL